MVIYWNVFQIAYFSLLSCFEGEGFSTKVCQTNVQVQGGMKGHNGEMTQTSSVNLLLHSGAAHCGPPTLTNS